ncbi:hypothetical protein EIH07_08055 [Chryseobacterium taklimakanense]|uniref:hypothetical protein n=1 Tax=Chryseobacterium taklimakanense TaxID=536441 RepID=UPI000F603478|nr:hypothetical protein [Chryseobacterium taklimakanense]AZI22992.1 hypothetical protein EIH07_08055 [Chryseobacterium taklimakanense]
MKTLVKSLLTIFIIIGLSAIIAFLYFDKKFTPEKNYLTVKNESGKIPVKWGNGKNSLLLPIKISGNSTTYFMQFDTGTPSTIFYKKTIENIPNMKINRQNETATTKFSLGNLTISSDKFKVLNYGDKSDKNDTLKIIGTIGSDILENRITLLNFKENFLEFNLNTIPNNFVNKLSDFQFKKRKIIVKGKLRNKDEKFLYDTGASAYQLLTNKEVWQNLKLANSKVKIENGNSWGNTLTTFTAKANEEIFLGKGKIHLNEVTYVEGFSKTQYLLMKFSGMTGMFGNTIFLNNKILIDAKSMKIGVE